jgi:CheY-like chemotaxis protein
MNIIYADDDQLSLEIVSRALQARGHSVRIINTSRAAEMLSQFSTALKNPIAPQVIILDGHNVARDPQGNTLADLKPAQMVDWLRRHGLPSQVRLVLYSSDDHLVEEIRADQQLGFSAAISKAGAKGGLKALLEAVETRA